MHNQLRNLISSLVCLPLLIACGGGGGGGAVGSDEQTNKNISPSDANALSEAIVIPNSSKIDGTIPAASGTATAPTVSRSDTDIAYSSGSQIQLPIDYSGSSNISQVIYSINGADSYFSLDLDSAGPAGTIVLPVSIPSSVSDGEFCSTVQFVDVNGEVSTAQTICTAITQPLECNNTKISGGEGVTSAVIGMNGVTGNIKVNYQTYTVKDKIDVYQNNSWIGGTGKSTDRSTIRTALDCSVATEQEGYVGEIGEFVFEYDPNLSGDIEVVVSGCENNGTAWEFTASCPGNYALSKANDFDAYIGTWSYYDINGDLNYVNILPVEDYADQLIIQNLYESYGGCYDQVPDKVIRYIETFQGYIDAFSDPACTDCIMDLWFSGNSFIFNDYEASPASLSSLNICP